MDLNKKISKTCSVIVSFRNPPKIVAKAFHKVLDEYQKYFETIEFAIYHTDYETENYKTFVNEFQR